MQAIRLCLLAGLLFGLAAPAHAVLDSAGDIWPNQDAMIGFARDLVVYAQVAKAGVTDKPGQGKDISALLLYSIDGGTKLEAPMVYGKDIGDNDEYAGSVPRDLIDGASTVVVEVVFFDATDGTKLRAADDQCDNPAPIGYIVDGIARDVLVCFQLCLEGIPNNGISCVNGWSHELTCWGAGISMLKIAPDSWQACVKFPRGAERVMEYKYLKDGCTTWEATPERFVAIDDSGARMTIRDSWEDGPSNCEHVANDDLSWGAMKAAWQN